MKEFMEKLIGRLEEIKERYDDVAFMEMNTNGHTLDFEYANGKKDGVAESISIINELAEEYNNGWIPCSERLPEAEERVLIFAKRKYRSGGFKNIITTAMYEDGTVLENDSKWRWEDLDAEWNEEDCYIIPEGWWEDKAYNPDGELNHAVDDEVIAWMPLPEPYKEVLNK